MLLEVLVLAAVVSVTASGNIEDNAFVVCAVSLILGFVMSVRRPTILLNILAPILAGQYLTSKSSGFMNEAECTGDVGKARMYDRWHALWHVSVVAASSEVFFLRQASSEKSDNHLLQTISPLSFFLLVAVALVEAVPEYPDVVAGVLFAISFVLSLAQWKVSKKQQNLTGVAMELVRKLSEICNKLTGTKPYTALKNNLI